MSFSRWWTETVAVVGDVVPLPLVALLLVLAGGLVAAGWHWFPAWLPRRWPRLPRWHRPTLRRPRLRLPRLRLRWPWRRRKGQPADKEIVALLTNEELPDVPPATFSSLADRLAAEGDYAGAVRERLRAMVRELVDRRVVEHRPGWTVTELAGAAGRAWPVVDGPMRQAGDIFSELWYAQVPARPEHDARMRGLADDLHRVLTGPPVPVARQQDRA